MADLTIKPQAGPGNKLIIQDQAGNDRITTSDAGIDIPAVTGNLTVAGDIIPSSPLSHRNIVMNGGMQINQRGQKTNPAVATANDYANLDRWKMFKGSGAYTSQKYTMSLAEIATTGQAYAMKLACTTADTSVAAGDYAQFIQYIEAQNLQHLCYGTSAAKTLTLSFWVKSNKTGIYCASIGKEDTTAYSIVNEYTISAANTWEKKTITITPTAGSTTLITNSGGVINNDTGPGMHVNFSLMIGTNYHAANNTWVAGSKYGTSNQVNWMDSISNTFYITGVQLELGSNATPYEQLSHQDEKRRCERYYQQTVEGDAVYVGRVSNTDAMNCHHYLTVPMRAQPTISYLPAGAGGNQAFHHNLMDHDSVSTSTSAPTIWSYASLDSCMLIFYISGGSGLTDSRVACVRSRWGMEIKAEY